MGSILDPKPPTRAELNATYADRKPATPASALSQRDFLRASDYGVGNGLGDDGAKLTTAIADARANGYPRVVLPSKQLNVSSAVDFTGVDLVGDGSTTILQKYWGTIALFNAAGTKTALSNLSVDAVKGARTLTLASTAGITPGTWLLVGANTAFYSGYATQYKGEQVQVKTVDSATVVTLRSPLRDGYLVSASAKVEKVNLARRSSIQGVEFQNTEQNLHNSGFIRFSMVQDARVEGVSQLYSDIAGLTFDNCIDPIGKDLKFRDFSDDGANGRFGYGLLVTGATQGGLFSDMHARNVRHAFTTAAVDNAHGVPRDITVSKGFATACGHAAWDTHPAGENIVFDALTATATQHAAFQLRARGGAVRNCVADNAPFGYWLANCDGLEITNSTARNIRKYMTDSGEGGIGVFIQAPTTRLSIRSMMLDGMDARGIQASNNTLTNSHIANNTVLNTGQNDSGRTGIQLSTGATGNHIDTNYVGNFGGVGGLMDYGVILPAGANNNVVRNTRLVGSVVNALTVDQGTGNTVTA